jgi:hypothetical protein
MSNRYLTSGGRYPVLRALALLYLIGAVITAGVGIASIVWALGWSAPRLGTRLMYASQLLGGTFLAVISLLAIAEVLKLFMDIEHNSRMIRLGDSVGTALGGSNGGGSPNVTVAASRLTELDEETAEGALIRGH